MATSFSLSSLISFISTSTPLQKAPPPNLSLSSSVYFQKQRNGLVPMAAEESLSSSSPSSSSSSSSSYSLSNELASVMCPSLTYSNTIFFKSAYNVQVIVDENEPEERLLNRFRREVMKTGVIQESKRRRFFENKQDEKKRKSREAAKRNRRRRPQSRFSQQNRQEASTSKKDDGEEDNWELPEGDLPL